MTLFAIVCAAVYVGVNLNRWITNWRTPRIKMRKI